MATNPLVGQLFSLNGGEPAPLTDRIHLGSTTVYLNAEAEQGNVITADDLAVYGYVGPIDKPPYDIYRQTLVWLDGQYVTADLSDEIREAMWSQGRVKLDAEIAALSNLAALRAAQLTEAGAATDAVEAFRSRLLAAEASSGCPMEVVLPSTALLHFQNSPSVDHPLSREWCIQNWESDVDRGYMSENGGSDYFHITDEDVFNAFLTAHKDEINLYAMGQEFQALVYPTELLDNLDRTATITVELAGDAVGYLYSVDGGDDVTKWADDLSFTITGSGEHLIKFAALSDNGEGSSYTHSFYIQ